MSPLGLKFRVWHNIRSLSGLGFAVVGFIGPRVLLGMPNGRILEVSGLETNPKLYLKTRNTHRLVFHVFDFLVCIHKTPGFGCSAK